MQTLFDGELIINNADEANKLRNKELFSESEFHDITKKPLKSESELTTPFKIGDNRIKKIVWFYTDNTFEEFIPAK